MTEMAGPFVDGVVDRPFSAFYAEAYPGLVRLGIALTGSVGDAEDLAQETLSRALTRWTRVSALDSPIGWCRHVCVNLVYSRTRRLRREASALLRLGSLRNHEADAIALSEGASEFWAAVRSLPPRQAQVVALRYAADLQAVDIAETLGRDAATVRSHLHAARRFLAVRLDASVDEEDPL